MWLKWLLLYLYPAVDDPEPAAADPAADDPAADLDADPADPDAPDADPDDGTTDPDPGEPPREGRAQKRIRELNERLQATNRQLEDERRRNSAQPTTQPRATDTQFEAEEARLRAADCSDWERWQINSNRTLRRNEAQSQQAVAMAADMADRASFSLSAASDPRMKRYQERVETKFQELKAQGKFTPRDAIYTWMLGEDVRKAKPKPKAAASEPTTPARPAGPTAAQRGQPVGRRADMNGKGQQTEAEKRIKRLEGVNI